MKITLRKKKGWWGRRDLFWTKAPSIISHSMDSLIYDYNYNSDGGQVVRKTSYISLNFNRLFYLPVIAKQWLVPTREQ